MGGGMKLRVRGDMKYIDSGGEVKIGKEGIMDM